MRTPVIAGNWKCNLRLDSAFQLASGLRERIGQIKGVEKIVCPPFVLIPSVEVVLSLSSIKVGAQDVHWEDDAAATGEVGPAMLAELVDYVIIGHSERRHGFGETDGMVNRKLKAALAAGLQPVMCLGETAEERRSAATEQVLLRQIRAGLDDIEVPEGFIIAYEPVWAIGTGTPATAQDAAEAIGLVRGQVAQLYGAARGESVRILYGGSVTADNIGDFMSMEGIDGSLVGGASLKVDAFAAIVQEAARVKAVR